MTAASFLSDLLARGVRLSADGERLKVDAPLGCLTAADRQKLIGCKTELLTIITSAGSPFSLPADPAEPALMASSAAREIPPRANVTVGTMTALATGCEEAEPVYVDIETDRA
jgi:hypothetical protein